MTRKVLIVDDELSVRNMIADFLHDAEFEVCIAADGQQGLSVLSEFQPDVVISDVWMPSMDGYHFCRIVRSRAPNTAIIMITGVRQEAGVLRDMNVDVDDYVIKPIVLADLMQRIESSLEKKQLAAKGEANGATTLTQSPTVEQDDGISSEKRMLTTYQWLSEEDKELLQRIADKFLASQ